MKELIQKLAGLLNEHHIRFLVFGGIASVKYGTPRATFDIDIVLKREDIPLNFIDLIGSAGVYPVEGISIGDLKGSPYTTFTDDKSNEVDFWIDVDGFEFDNDAWKHKSDERINNVVVHFMSPEDMIVSKSAIDQIGSDNIDILSILINEADNFDLDYFIRRIKQFEVDDKIEDIKSEINKLSKDNEIRPYLKKTMVLMEKI